MQFLQGFRRFLWRKFGFWLVANSVLQWRGGMFAVPIDES
jgi:hypothetical protein